MDSLPPLDDIERKPSIEALEGLTSALKASSSSECLTRLRQAPAAGLSRLHRMALFLRLKHSPPNKARDGSAVKENFAFALDGSARLPTRRALFHEAKIQPIEAVLQIRWEGLCDNCSSALVLGGDFVRDLKAWKVSLDACVIPPKVPSPEEPLTPACPAPLEEPLLAAVGASATKRTKPKGMSIILGLDQSHGLSFEWHLSHEMLINPDFVFETEESILGSGAGNDKKRLVRIFMSAMRKNKCDAIMSDFRNALNEEDYSLFENLMPLVTESKGKLHTLFEDIRTATKMAAMSINGKTSDLMPLATEALDLDLLLQMIKHKTFFPSQLAEMVKTVLRVVLEGAICRSICAEFEAWANEKCSALAQLDTCVDALASLPETLLDLLHHLKQHRVNEMNVKMKLLLPAFKRQGSDYERGLVQKSLEDGSLKLEVTGPWLDGAKTALAVRGGSTDTSTVHLHALVNLLMTEDADRPEVLSLDETRVSVAQVTARNLTFVMSFYSIISQFASSKGVAFTPEETSDCKEALLEIMANTDSAVHAAGKACDFAQAAAAKKLNIPLGPRSPQLSKALRRAVKDAEGSVRRVFQKRIAEYLIEAIPEKGESKAGSMALIEPELEKMAGKLRAMYAHNDLIFQPLFTAILHN